MLFCVFVLFCVWKAKKRVLLNYILLSLLKRNEKTNDVVVVFWCFDVCDVVHVVLGFVPEATETKSYEI